MIGKGLRSKFFYYFAVFVVAFGGALAVVSPAMGAGPTSYPVTVCGNTTDWFVNGDEGTADTADDGQGDRRPLAVAEGLVFAPADLIHHLVPGSDLEVTDSLQPGSFVANPAPDSSDFFSIEVADAPPGPANYGTLRWNSGSGKWSATKGGSTFEDTNPVTVLDHFGLSHHARTFGVGYTNAPPGTVTSLVSSISFGGVKYDVSCPVAPSTVPGPVVTVTKVVTITVPEPTTSGPTETVSPSPTPGTTTTVPELIPTPTSVLADETSGGGNLVGWGIGTAGVLGLIVATAGAIGIARGRRRQRAEEAAAAESAGGRHRVDNSETTMLPAISGDIDMSDYGPTAAYDPVLGGYAGESYSIGSDTQPIPPVEETPDGPRPE